MNHNLKQINPAAVNIGSQPFVTKVCLSNIIMSPAWVSTETWDKEELIVKQVLFWWSKLNLVAQTTGD